MKRAVAETLHRILTQRRLGPLAHRVYDLVTRTPFDTPQVRNYGEMTPGLFRGSQPTRKGFAALAANGVRAVINLRPESDWEERLVRTLGLRYFKIPVSVMGHPTIDQGLAFLDVVTVPENCPAFFHCFHGADRTGAMGAIYRIAAQGWSLEEAIAEMRRYRFHDGYQETKLAFVREFDQHWQGLSPAARNALLHRKHPETDVARQSQEDGQPNRQ